MTPPRDNTKGILLEVGTNEVEFLLLRLGTQQYGVNVSKVCQIMIFDRAKITPLPKQRPEFVGLMTFRDQSISVIDMRMHLNVKPVEHEGNTELILVTEFNRRITGFVIDAVDRIERCTWKQFEPITETVCDKDQSSVVGTVTLKDGIVIILDLETIMSTIDPAMSIEQYKDQIADAKIDRSKVSIAYCEDSALVQKLLVSSLTAAGFKNIQTFNTGADGFSYFQNNPAESIDIILSDIEMPRMDGLTLCKETKSLPGYDKIPFVFFSSTINEQMQVKCRSVGGAACFSKPEIHHMVDAIEELLAQKGKQ